MTTTLIIIAIIFFHLYLELIWEHEGVLKSISSSYYLLERRWVFQVWTLSYSAIIAYAGGTVMFYIAGVLMSLVAFFPTIKNPKHLVFHQIGAIGSISLAFIDMWIQTRYFTYPLIFIGGSISAILLFKKYCIWYIEILAFELIIFYLIWHQYLN